MKFLTKTAAMIFCSAILAQAGPGRAEIHTAANPQVLGTEPLACPEAAKLKPQQAAQIRCFYAVVPEDYAHPEGRRVKVAVAVVRAPGRTGPIDPDPVLTIHAGPGAYDLPRASSYLSHPYLAHHDLVLFDQRGTGLSQPFLCRNLNHTEFLAKVEALTPPAELALRHAGVDACAQSMIAAGLDLSAYGTVATVDDIESIRKTLGVRRWKAIAGSWATVVGLHLLATRPETVESMVLDSVVLPDDPEHGEWSEAFSRLLDRYDVMCAHNADCHATYGSLRQLFGRAMARAQTHPMVVPLDPKLGAPGDHMVLKPSDVGIIAQGFSYARPNIPIFPLFLKLAAEGDGTALAPFFRQYASSQRRPGFGKFFAVMCSERLPFEDKARMDAFLGRDPALKMALSQMNDNFDLCANWPWRLPVRLAGPPPSPVPVLVLGGEYDAVAPIEHSRLMAQRLGPQARFVAIPGTGHVTYKSNPCAMTIVAGFFDDPHKTPDLRCVAKIEQPRFVTRAVLNPRAGAIFQQGLAGDASGFGRLLGGGLLIAAMALTAQLILGLLKRPDRSSQPLPWRKVALSFCSSLAGLGYLFLVVAQTSVAAQGLLTIGVPITALASAALGVVAILLAVWGGVEAIRRSSSKIGFELALFAVTLLAVTLGAVGLLGLTVGPIVT